MTCPLCDSILTLCAQILCCKHKYCVANANTVLQTQILCAQILCCKHKTHWPSYLCSIFLIKQQLLKLLGLGSRASLCEAQNRNSGLGLGQKGMKMLFDTGKLFVDIPISKLTIAPKQLSCLSTTTTQKKSGTNFPQFEAAVCRIVSVSCLTQKLHIVLSALSRSVDWKISNEIHKIFRFL